MTFCLGYDVNRLNDGAGAQLQRILVVEGIAHLLKAGYFHQDITSIDSNYGDGLNSLESKRKFIDELNAYLNFKDFSCQHEYHQKINSTLVHKSGALMLPLLRVYRIILSKRRKNYLLLIQDPYSVARKKIEVYDCVRNRHKFATQNRKNGKKVSVKIHLPWAGIGKGQLSDRKISIDWYKSLLGHLDSILREARYEVVYTFHTDGIRGLKDDLISLGISEETRGYWTDKGLLQDKTFNWSYIEIEEEFCFLENIEIKFGINAIEVWDDMKVADILVLTKSSLSNIAGLLNFNALKLVSEDVNGMPEDFVKLSEEELKSKSILQNIIINYLGNDKEISES